MKTRQVEMPPLPPDDRILVWIEEFLASLPIVSRRGLRSAHRYLGSVRSVLERALRDRDLAARNPEVFVKDFMCGVAFKELIDPDLPLDDPWVVDQAAKLCGEVLRKCNRHYRYLHPELVELAAAEALGWCSLLDLAKQLWGGEEIENPRAYLRTIIKRDVWKLREAAMRQAFPGKFGFDRVVDKHDRRLRKERSELDKVERRALAVKLALEEVRKARSFLERVAGEELTSVADSEADVPEQVLSAAIVGQIDRVVEDERFFTDVDRDTWARWKAAGFRGVDTAWPDDCSRHAGSQRLRALRQKLVWHLRHWR